MHFHKIHGLGNDFVLTRDLDPARHDLARTARALCDRHFGIGADGLILVLPSEKADFSMRIFNPDGSEAEMCGNGIRCFAKYVYEQGLTEKTNLAVETLAGIIKPQLKVSGGKVREVRVDMGRPRLAAAEIPVAGFGPGPVREAELTVDGTKLTFTAVSMGNPHAVIRVDDLARLPWQTLGPAVESHSAFPRKTNVEFAQVLGPQEVQVAVWERGAGATLACGTGACAAVVALSLTGRLERRSTVHLPGGDLEILWAENDHVYMTGPAATVFTGEYLLDLATLA
ncbi:MAG TPA: diaminopimelate epimerase [Firmicutes bacterium]|nr:diaminopimelate epimerase [Bacillota bacterium]